MRASWVGAFILAGCSFDASGTPTTSGAASVGSSDATSDGSSSQTSPVTSATGMSASTNATTTVSTTATTAGTTMNPTTSDPDTTGGVATGDGGSTGGPSFEGCPDTLPAEWIFCEDFESLADLNDVFTTANNPDNRLRIEDGPSVSGERALVVEHLQQDQWVGAVRIHFGDAVVGGSPIYAEDRDFEEIWFRAQVHLEDEWSAGGFGDLVKIEALEANRVTIAQLDLDAQLSSGSLVASAKTCVFGGVVPCDGDDDWQDLQEVQGDAGPTIAFDTSVAGGWHCVVARMQLNTPGVADGEVEVWLDGAREIFLTGVDFRESLVDPGINSVWLGTGWGNGGSPETMRRRFDDIVISAGPLGC